MVNSLMSKKAKGCEQGEVEVLCYRGCTGDCLDHECISVDYVHDHIY